MSSASLPIWSILMGFHSTVVVNVISWNKAYSIFPDATFLERETFVLLPLDDSSKKAIVKYGERGWKNWTSSENQRPDEKELPRSLAPKPTDQFRRVGDTKTWIVDLNIDSVGIPSTPDYVLEHACFITEELSWQASHHPGPSFRLWAILVENPILRYKYCEADRINFWDDMKRKLDDLTKLEIEKLDAEDRPDWFTAFFAVPDRQGHPNYRALDPLDKPSTWSYYDDLVPQWYADWERAKREASNISFQPASELLRETESGIAGGDR
jgi:hypothetical protein